MLYSFSCSKKSSNYSFDTSKKATEYEFRASKKETNYSFTLSKKVVDYEFYTTRSLREEKNYRDLLVFESAKAHLKQILVEMGLGFVEYRLPSEKAIHFLTPSGIQFSLRLLPEFESEVLEELLAFTLEQESKGIFTFWVRTSSYLPNGLVSSALGLVFSYENPSCFIVPYVGFKPEIDFYAPSDFSKAEDKKYSEANSTIMKDLQVFLLVKALEVWGVEDYISYKSLQKATGLPPSSVSGLLGSRWRQLLDKSKKAHRKIIDYRIWEEEAYGYSEKRLSLESKVLVVPPPTAITLEGRQLAKARAYRYREIKNSWH